MDYIEFIKEYRFPIIGGIVGFVIALLFIYFGFFKTIAVVLLTLIGIVAGQYIDKRWNSR